MPGFTPLDVPVEILVEELREEIACERDRITNLEDRVNTVVSFLYKQNQKIIWLALQIKDQGKSIENQENLLTNFQTNLDDLTTAVNQLSQK